MTSIDSWLAKATLQLQRADISSARLDAELILCHTLRQVRTYLHAHAHDLLEARIVEIADARLSMRSDRVPIAYIIGHKEFYGRQFYVTPATLIPRPETETLVELCCEYIPMGARRTIVDVGTGSGCIGITIKLERPDCDITLCDTSRTALTIAQKNASYHHAEVTCLKSDLLTRYLATPDIIVANLPYVATTWTTSPETAYEPAEALFAAREGLALIYRLVDQSLSALPHEGHLMLESDQRQHAHIASYASARNLHHCTTRGLIQVFKKT